MKKITIIIIIITIFSKLLGFIRNSILAALFGISAISDAYLLSLSIPRVIFTIIGVSISAGFISVYSSAISQKSREYGDYFTNNLTNILILIGSILLIFSEIFIDDIVSMFAPGISLQNKFLVINFTRITLFSIYGYLLVYIYRGYIHSQNKFVLASLIGIPFNIIIILFIILGKYFNLYMLPIGLVLGVFSQSLILFLGLKKIGFKYKIVLNLKDEFTKKLVLLSIPILFGVLIDQINTVVDKAIASTISIGGISSIVYSFELNIIIFSIFSVPISSIIYPYLSKMYVNNDIEAFKIKIIESLTLITFFTLPTMFGLFYLSQSFIGLIYGRGEFSSDNVLITGQIFQYYLLGALGISFREIFTRIFYSMKDTKTPMILSSVALMINIFLNLILSKIYGLIGLAIATTISVYILNILMIIAVRYKIGKLGLKKFIVNFIKIFISAFVTIIILHFMINKLPIANETIAFLVSLGIFAILFLVIIIIFKVEEINELIISVINYIKKRVGYEKNINN